MLQLKNVCKSYTTGNFTQRALDDVSISFRDNEFVAILGPSGSGKTTLLNIVGGLDHYDSGDLIIEGISTKQFKDRDWDAYRNNRIGFVFQSYNLIPHQTVLANVELALTLSGVSRDERRARAIEALQRVGLGAHIDKKPAQMSGGQMQRVAIARALINDPEILLADEPTGALDSKTSVQIMDLLTEIADDRLVVMVTHNPELADQYATRIVNLADGRITHDSDPYEPTAEEIAAANAKPTRRTRMSFLTALSLSANNLMTKKGRTLMTAIAGSIGIIGIAAILALANGVNNYIKTVEEETLSVYPLQILSTGFDFTTMFVGMGSGNSDDSSDSGGDGSGGEGQTLRQEVTSELEEGHIGEARTITRMFASFGNNDLAALKEFLDSDESGIDKYASSVFYEYAVTPQIFDTKTAQGVRQLNPDKSFASLGIGSGASTNSIMSMSMSTDMFSEMPRNDVIFSQYDVKAGHWPEKENELVLVLSQTGRINDFMSYLLGLRDSAELEDMVKKFTNEEEVEVDTNETVDITYEDVMGMKFKLVKAPDFYRYDEEFGVWVDKSSDESYMKSIVNAAEDIEIVGIVQPKPEANALALRMGLYYTPELVDHLVNEAAESQIVKDQLAKPKTDVFSGKSFDEEEEEEKSGFDMGALFSIDESALTQAFQFDMSAFDPSSMDFSNMDLSNMELPADSSEMPDLSGMSDMKMPEFSAEDLEKMFPELDMGSVIASVEIRFTDNGEAIGELLSGYANWASERLQGNLGNLGSLAGGSSGGGTGEGGLSGAKVGALTDGVQGDESSGVIARIGDLGGYFKTKQGKEQLEKVAASLDTEHIEKQVVAELAKQLNVDPSEVSSALMSRVMEYYGSQVASSIQGSLGGALEGYLTTYLSAILKAMFGQMGAVMESFGSALNFDADAFANAFQFNMDEEDLTELLTSMMRVEEHSYDNNLKKLGYADFAKPSEISIYPKDFESKEHIIQILDDYNDRMRQVDEDKVISYTDLVGTLMESVTTIINMISTVLIAFVAISLIVSSIMIGVITYISVLERKKEIGILRSIGASKRDVSHVFNAETVIEGLIAGLLGVGVTALGCIPANIIVYNIYDVPNVALLPVNAAVILVVISVVLTFIAGLIPSGSASRKDPVEALRSE